MAQKHKFAGAAYDTLLMLRNTAQGNLTTTGTTAGVYLGGTPVAGMSAKIIVPAAVATTTLIVEIQVADTDVAASYVTIGQTPTITAAGEYAVRFGTKRLWVRQKSSVAGTSPNFGAVSIGIVP